MVKATLIHQYALERFIHRYHAERSVITEPPPGKEAERISAKQKIEDE